MTGVFTKGEIWRQIHTQGKFHIEMKAGVRVMLLQAKGCQQTTRSRREAWDSFSGTASEGTNPADTQS